MRKRITVIIYAALFLLPPSISMGQDISFLIIDSDSYLVNKAVNKLDLPEGINVKFFICRDIKKKDRTGIS